MADRDVDCQDVFGNALLLFAMPGQTVAKDEYTT
jgi:hypothetical protein